MHLFEVRRALEPMAAEGLAQRDAVERTLREHRSIASAIVAREPNLAKAWATVHIAGGEEWIRDSLVLDANALDAKALGAAAPA